MYVSLAICRVPCISVSFLSRGKEGGRVIESETRNEKEKEKVESEERGPVLAYIGFSLGSIIC